MAAAILLCICFKIKLKDGGIPDIIGGGRAENPLVGVFEFDRLCVDATPYFGFSVFFIIESTALLKRTRCPLHTALKGSAGC